MAIVILGGLITSTLVNLFIVPTLYLRFGRARQSHARFDGPAGPGGAPRDRSARAVGPPRRLSSRRARRAGMMARGATGPSAQTHRVWPSVPTGADRDRAADDQPRSGRRRRAGYLGAGRCSAGSRQVCGGRAPRRARRRTRWRARRPPSRRAPLRRLPHLRVAQPKASRGREDAEAAPARRRRGSSSPPWTAPCRRLSPPDPGCQAVRYPSSPAGVPRQSPSASSRTVSHGRDGR